MDGTVGARTMFNGREYDYFSGTSYLGLQNHPTVLQAAAETLQRYGLSTASSRGGLGEHPVYDELEREGCAYFDVERVAYFPSGYQGPEILTQFTQRWFERIFIDSSAHFSLWDAAYATNLPIVPFHHLSPQSLEEKLRRELLPRERPLVLSDGVFPISGEIAPLPDYLALVRAYHGRIYVDDAHAVGILGEHGRGTPEYFGINAEECHTCGTLAKALGGYGGIIWGRADWVNELERSSRVWIGSSPPPLVVAAASASALKVARQTPQLRQQLAQNVAQARAGFSALGWPLTVDSPVPILCLEALPGLHLGRIRTGLLAQQIALTLVRSYPSAPAGGALRVAIFATHDSDQIERLIDAVGKLM